MKVFQGMTGQAGQPWALAEGLRQIGIDADSVSIGRHKFGYQTHRSIDIEQFKEPIALYNYLRPLIDEYDVFHFHARSFMMNWPSIAFPSLQDIALIKLHGKKVFFHFRGQEIRLASVFREVNPFHYADDVSKYLFDKMPDTSKLVLRDAIASLCDGVFVVDPELQTYVPNSIIVPRALDARAWDFVGAQETNRPLVVHAPSRRGVKGTGPLLVAIEELRAEGLDFEFSLVENVTHEEAKAVYRRADILVDQLRIGWYGVLAVEALALGKPVIAYIRDDIWNNSGGSIPVVNANTSNIKEKLRDLILDIDRRRALSIAARDYFLNVHSATSVARKLSEIYVAQGTAKDLSGYLRLQNYQHKITSKWAVSTGQAHAFASNVRPRRTNLERLVHLNNTRRQSGTLAAVSLVKAWLSSKARKTKDKIL